jgi:flagellar biosynthesis protein FliR
LTQSFQFGLRVSAPAVLAMIVATLTVGFVSRSIPQLTSLTIGMGLNALLLFAVLLFSLGAVGWVFQEFVQQAAGEIFSTV